MGIDISNKVSDEDRQAVLNDASSNTLSDEEIDDFFDSTDDLFGDFNFGGDAGTESNINSTNSDSGVQWGNVNNSSNQNNGVSTQNKTKTDELFDKALEGTAEVSKNIFGILKQLKSSFKISYNRRLRLFSYIRVKNWSIIKHNRVWGYC